MRFFGNWVPRELYLGSKDKEKLGVRELQIQDFDDILDLQAKCLQREKELNQVGWSSEVTKNDLMRILVSGFILGAFALDKNGGEQNLVAYVAFYHLDSDQPISHYAKRINENLSAHEQLMLCEVAEMKKPRVHPDYRGHQLSKKLVQMGLATIYDDYPDVQGVVLSFPTANIYDCPRNTRSLPRRRPLLRFR